jgi:spore coat polysaccharide biosynthesis protein SpsF
MGSSRFPGKMSADLGGFPIIDWVLRRSKKSNLVDKFILATSTKTEDDFLIKKANDYMIGSYRGSENNVLSRFVEVANDENADIIVRICADNPFICGNEIDRVISLFLEKMPDYAFNHIPAMGNNYVDGIGAEVFTYDTLTTIAKNTENDSQLEHVTKYIWDNKKNFDIQIINAPVELANPEVGLDVDTKEDLSCLNNILEKHKNWIFPEDVCVKDILKYYTTQSIKNWINTYE